MMAECSERLVQAGLPLWRVGVFVRKLHSEIIGWSFIWKPGEEVHVGTVDFNFRATPEFTFSPLAVVFRDGVEVRADPRGLDSERFPILVDLCAEGVTDYLALPLMFMDRAVHASSWTTKQPGGFTDKQLDATVVSGAAGALYRDRQLAPHRNVAARHVCGKIAPASGCLVGKSAAAIPRP